MPNDIWNSFLNLRIYIKFSVLGFMRNIVLFFIIIFVSYKYELFSEWELQYKKLLTDIGGYWFVIGLGDVYMKSSPKPLTDLISSINEELLNPLIVFIEDTNVPAQELISMLRDFLKDIFKVDIDKKKLPPYIEGLVSENYNFYKLLPESIKKDVKSDFNLFFIVYDLLIHFSPLILAIAVLFPLKLIKSLIYLLIFIFSKLFYDNYGWCIYILNLYELVLVFLFYFFFLKYWLDVIKDVGVGELYRKGMLVWLLECLEFDYNNVKTAEMQAILLVIDILLCTIWGAAMARTVFLIAHYFELTHVAWAIALMCPVLAPLGFLYGIFIFNRNNLKIKLPFYKEYEKNKKAYKDDVSPILFRNYFCFWMVFISFFIAVVIYFLLLQVLNDNKVNITALFNSVSLYVRSSSMPIMDNLYCNFYRNTYVPKDPINIPFTAVLILLVSILFNANFEFIFYFLIYFKKYLYSYYSYREKDCKNTIAFLLFSLLIANIFIPFHISLIL